MSIFDLFKRKPTPPAGDEFFNEMLSAASYRPKMDRILASRAIFVAANDKDRLLNEATEVVSFVIADSLHRSGKTLKFLSEKERGVLGILTMVASDHLSRMAAASFEMTTMAVFLGLFSPSIGAEAAGMLLNESGENFNQLSRDPRTALGISQYGKLVSKFFDTNEDVYLEGLAALTRSWMKDNS